MKRFHVHLHVRDLSESIAWYTRVLGQPPSRTEVDYAKWQLTDPPLNFAISSRSSEIGLGHLGFEVTEPQALDTLRQQAQAAELPLQDEGQTQCCYAQSDKFWLTDPQGVAWEHFHTQGSISTFDGQSTGSACCSGSACVPAKISIAAAPATGCCTPAAPGSASCC